MQSQIQTPICLPQSDLLAQMGQYEHEQVLFFQDKATGLKGIIAVHDTTLGPSLGGCRIWNYASEVDALYDVLRLSRGMTYKSAISGINLGGGKSVIISNDPAQRTEAFWLRFGEFVDSLNGKYITAEDVGTSTKEIAYIMQKTKHVSGKPIEQGGGGDPSPFTAYGVYLGMKAAAKFTYGNDSLEGKKILVQGTGHVGQYLIDHLSKEGARIMIADISQANLKLVADKHKVEIINPSAIFETAMDIYAPCAMGATLNESSITEMKCNIVAGAANNQLSDESVDGLRLNDRGIVYAPDFLINAGGVINCYKEVKNLSDEETNVLIENIYGRTLEVLDRARERKSTPQITAIAMAKERIEKNKIG
jgi:leucine dehydrogenase